MKKKSKLFMSCGLLFVSVLLLWMSPALLTSVGVLPESPYRPILIIAFQLFAWIAGTLVVCLLFRALVWDGIVRRASGWSTPDVIKSLSDVTIILAASVIAAKTVFDQNVVAAITALGAVGIVLSFGIKELISDLMTGLAINLEHSFAIGDWISINDGQAGTIFGRVVQINWRTAHLLDDNQSYFIVPNREIGNSTITVYSNPTKFYRFSVPVELDYTVEVSAAKRILLNAALAVTQEESFVESPRPSVIISRFPANGVEYSVRYWLDMSGKVAVANAKSLVLESILHHLRLVGLSPSFTKIEHFKVDAPDMLAVTPELDVAKMLARMDFLRPLKDSEISYLSKQGLVESWNANQKVISQGDAGESMFVVLEGVLDAFIKNDFDTNMRVGQVQVGDIFGEMSLLTGEPRSATITTVSSVKTLEITKSVFSKLLNDRPELRERLSEIMAERQLQSQTTLSEKQKEIQRKRTYRQVYSKIKDFFGTA